MTIQDLRVYCLSKKEVSEEYPFDNVTAVFKVAGKMFCLADTIDFESINVKCDPDEAVSLRERFSDVLPGYHMNKKHWNTVNINAKISDKLIFQWIDDSYSLVVKTLPKATQVLLLGD